MRKNAQAVCNAICIAQMERYLKATALWPLITIFAKAAEFAQEFAN
jgi:hypothetical protein